MKKSRQGNSQDRTNVRRAPLHHTFPFSTSFLASGHEACPSSPARLSLLRISAFRWIYGADNHGGKDPQTDGKAPRPTLPSRPSMSLEPIQTLAAPSLDPQTDAWRRQSRWERLRLKGRRHAPPSPLDALRESILSDSPTPKSTT